MAEKSRGAIALPGRTALDPEQEKLLKRLPPEYREELTSLRRPTAGEMARIVEALPEETREPVKELLDRTRPNKQGMHRMYRGFRPCEVKLFHGTGADPLRPRNCMPGQLYSADSRNLSTPLDVIVIGGYQGRTLWPPRPDDAVKPPGTVQVEEANQNQCLPVCESFDRRRGSRFGDCLACERRTIKYKEGGCGKGVTMFFVDREMTGIYCYRFTKTLRFAGEALLKLLSQGGEIYSRYFRLETQERTDEKTRDRWFTLRASPVIDPKNPENEYVSEALYPLLNAFSRVIDLDVFYPGLANVYDPPARTDVREVLAQGTKAGKANRAA